MRPLVGLALAGLLLAVVPAQTPALEVGPDADLCASLQSLPLGEELVLQPGDYSAGCTIRRGGRPGSPLVIRASEPARQPRLIPSGHLTNMLEIHASDVTIRNITFWGGSGDADGIRIISGHRITVEGCRFFQMGGIALAATHTSIQGLTARGNSIVESRATAMYFGCHDGISCAISKLVVDGNYIDTVTDPGAGIGYGVQVKLNSSGVIRDNVIRHTKGPGIMIYGARDLSTTSVVERNLVLASRASSGILLGGGPALVRNNISGWNSEAGISLEDYGGRNLLRAIRVLHNTVYHNAGGGIAAPEQGYIEASISNNAIHARTGTRSLPKPRAGLLELGNLDCTLAICFTDPERMDFSPFPGSLLVAPGRLRALNAVPFDDYSGSPRGMLPAIGAIERPTGPLQLRMKQK